MIRVCEDPTFGERISKLNYVHIEDHAYFEYAAGGRNVQFSVAFFKGFHPFVI
jgi:hypothetical protein